MFSYDILMGMRNKYEISFTFLFIHQDIDDPPVGNEPRMRLWLENIRSRREQLVNKKEERRRRRTDMTKRRTHASQQRMRIITELAQGTLPMVTYRDLPKIAPGRLYGKSPKLSIHPCTK
jgi:hypothetical protein